MSDKGIVSIYLATEGIRPKDIQVQNSLTVKSDTQKDKSYDILPFAKNLSDFHPANFGDVIQKFKTLGIQLADDKVTDDDLLLGLTIKTEEQRKLLRSIITDPMNPDFAIRIRELFAKNPVAAPKKKPVKDKRPCEEIKGMDFSRQLLISRINYLEPLELIFACLVAQTTLVEREARPSNIISSNVSLSNITLLDSTDLLTALREQTLHKTVNSLLLSLIQNPRISSISFSVSEYLKTLISKCESTADIFAIAMLFAKTRIVINEFVASMEQLFNTLKLHEFLGKLKSINDSLDLQRKEKTLTKIKMKEENYSKLVEVIDTLIEYGYVNLESIKGAYEDKSKCYILDKTYFQMSYNALLKYETFFESYIRLKEGPIPALQYQTKSPSSDASRPSDTGFTISDSVSVEVTDDQGRPIFTLNAVETSGQGLSCGYRAIAQDRDHSEEDYTSRRQATASLLRNIDDPTVRKFVGREIETVIATNGFGVERDGNRDADAAAYGDFIEGCEPILGTVIGTFSSRDEFEAACIVGADEKNIERIKNISYAYGIRLRSAINAVKNEIQRLDAADHKIPNEADELLTFAADKGIPQELLDKLRSINVEYEQFKDAVYRNENIVKAYIETVVRTENVMMDLPDGVRGVIDALAYIQKVNLVVVGDLDHPRAPKGRVIHEYQHPGSSETVYILFHPGHFSRAIKLDSV
jgi:hypothetical protein